MKLVAWIVLGCISLTATTQAASFKCSKAASKAENLICGDPELSQLDEEMDAVYKYALPSARQADSIREAQKQWLKARNSCADVACVEL